MTKKTHNNKMEEILFCLDAVQLLMIPDHHYTPCDMNKVSCLLDFLNSALRCEISYKTQ